MHWPHRRLPACWIADPTRLTLALLVSMGTVSGCATSRSSIDLSGWDARSNAVICDGADGSPSTWDDLIEAASAADVIILGEMHDDAKGHRVQLAILESLLERFPKTVLSMEMLDRRKQATVDDYLAGLIDLDTFYERIAMPKWRRISKKYLDRKISRKRFKRAITRIGWPDWEGNYQPMIDAVKSAGASVVAANTPWALYTKLSGKEGYDRLDSLTDAQKRLFERPYEEYGGSYRERFWKVLVARPEGGTDEDADGADDAETANGSDDDAGENEPRGGEQALDYGEADETAEPNDADTAGDAGDEPDTDVERASDGNETDEKNEKSVSAEIDSDAQEPAHEGLDDETVERMYRGQLVMDATMAASMADALAAGAEKVVHLVGQFHCDFSGGLVQELRRRAADAKILVISLQPREDPAWIEEDRDRADFIAFTRTSAEK